MSLLIGFLLFGAAAQQPALSVVQEHVFSVRNGLPVLLLDFLPDSKNEFLLTKVSLETQERQ